jgi:hypothetical protein
MAGLGGGHGGDLGRACRREAEGEGKKRARERGGREKREGTGELIPSSRRSVAFIPTGIDGGIVTGSCLPTEEDDDGRCWAGPLFGRRVKEGKKWENGLSTRIG